MPDQARYLFLHSERQADIESHNTILVERMMRNTSYIKTRNDTFFKDTLNGEYKSRLSRQIDDGNQVIPKLLRNW